MTCRWVLAFAVGLATLALGCGSPAAGTPDASMVACMHDSDCDDHVFCTGIERCAHGFCTRTDTCRMGQTCNEHDRACFTSCDQTQDADGDGVRAIECGGNDCDDSNPDRAPGRAEVCDTANLDEDCDPTTFGVRDLDADGVADAHCCNVQSSGQLLCGTDCDDSSSTVSPRSPEVCNGLDEDCDGEIDEGVLTSFYVDMDGDGYGAIGGAAMTSCNRAMGYAPTNDDCDDSNRGINPGAVEICDGHVDEDCSGMVDDVPGGCMCTNGMSRDCGLSGRCAGATQTCMTGAWGGCTIAPIDETCNGSDDDCDGSIDEMLTVVCYHDDDNDGLATFGDAGGPQCPDETRAMAPYLRCPRHFTGTAASSAQTGDCDDSRAQQGLPSACYRDGDHDTYGTGAPQWQCPADPCPSGYVTNNRDCCDSDGSSHPGVTTYGNGNNCGSSDTDCDGMVEHQHGTWTCSPLFAGCAAGATGGDGVSPYMAGNIGCGVIGQFADGCVRSGTNCNWTWSGAGGTSSYGVQQCR